MTVLRCDQCAAETGPQYITELEEKVDTEMEEIGSMDAEAYTELLAKYKPLLPPTHYLMVSIAS